MKMDLALTERRIADESTGHLSLRQAGLFWPARVRFRPAVCGKGSIGDVRDVRSAEEELHDEPSLAGHYRPPGFRSRILLEPADLLSFTHEIDLPESSLSRFLHAVGFIVEIDYKFLIDERLLPHAQ